MSIDLSVKKGVKVNLEVTQKYLRTYLINQNKDFILLMKHFSRRIDEC